MKDATQKLLAKAARALEVAKRLNANEDAEFVVGRAYYAMFYVAGALLNEKDQHFRKHRGVHRAFAEQFVKSGLMDGRYHRWLLEAFAKRITSDYGLEADFTEEDASLLIKQAHEFLDAAKQFLAKKL